MKKILGVILLIFIINFGVTDCKAVTDIGGTNYEEQVMYLIENNIISGYQDNTFRPDNTITRAEITTIITKLNNLELLESSNSKFNDINNHWAQKYINTLAEAGYVAGYETGEFKPNNDITYGEVVTMLLNSLGYKEEVRLINREWPKNYINMAGILGLFDDYDAAHHYGFEFKKVTRGEVAILVYNCMNPKLGIDKKFHVKNDISDEELKKKVEEYLDILSEPFNVGFPSFNNIDEVDESWIWNSVCRYAMIKLGFSYEDYIKKSQVDQIQTELFGKIVANHIPDELLIIREPNKNEPYYTFGWYESSEYTPEIYIEDIKIQGRKITVQAIPYIVYYTLGGDLDWIDIHDINDISVVEMNSVWKWEDVPNIIAQNKNKFLKNIIELEINEKTGILQIMSSKIAEPDNYEGIDFIIKDADCSANNVIVPYISDENKFYIGKINDEFEEMAERCKQTYMEEIGECVDGLSYSYAIKNNILSILIKENWAEGDGYLIHHTYNIDLRTQRLLDNDYMLRNVDKSKLDIAVQEAIQDVVNGRELREEEKIALKNETYSNYKRLLQNKEIDIFIDTDGKTKVTLPIYAAAGVDWARRQFLVDVEYIETLIAQILEDNFRGIVERHENKSFEEILTDYYLRKYNDVIFSEEDTETLHKINVELITKYMTIPTEMTGWQLEEYQATSTLYDGKFDYSVNNLQKVDYFNSWVEGKQDYGIGEKVTIKSLSPCYCMGGADPQVCDDKTLEYYQGSLTGVFIINGYATSEELYQKNSRVKKMKLTIDDKVEYILELEDTMKPQVFDFEYIQEPNYDELKPIKAEFEILEVYEGNKYSDTALTVLQVKCNSNVGHGR